MRSIKIYLGFGAFQASSPVPGMLAVYPDGKRANPLSTEAFRGSPRCRKKPESWSANVANLTQDWLRLLPKRQKAT